MPQKKETSREEEALENALFPIINRLIDKNFENADEKIAKKIAPLIGGAIREQIKNQKDDIVDALYPVMGNMISKFITKSFEELLNNINDKIQNGFSIESIKRKIKAKIRGVSESELLLEENSSAKIKAALLIHKESGSLLCKVEGENTTLSDADMLASMMSAIRSFVNEWISNNENYKELGEIEYGGNKIIIEASGYSYLAVIIEGAAYTKTYEKIRQTLEKIVLKYAGSLQSFDGNFKTFPSKEIELILKKLLVENSLKTKPQRKKSPLLWIVPFLLLAYLAYTLYNNYIDETYEHKIETRIEQTPALTPFKIYVDVHNNIATLTGVVPFAYHKKILNKLLSKIDGLKSIHNNIKIIPTLTDPMQVSTNIAYLIKGININKNNNLTYTFDYNTLIVKGFVADKKTKEKLLQALHAIKGIQTITDKTVIKTPEFHANLYFQTASAKLDHTNHTKLTKLVNYIKKSHTDKTIQIQAYSDMIGNAKTNRRLAKRRVETIKRFLQNEEHLKNNVITEIFDTPPKGIDPKTQAHKARCIKISLKANNNV